LRACLASPEERERLSVEQKLASYNVEIGVGPIVLLESESVYPGGGDAASGSGRRFQARLDVVAVKSLHRNRFFLAS
jgi:hypothetical protein